MILPYWRRGLSRRTSCVCAGRPHGSPSLLPRLAPHRQVTSAAPARQRRRLLPADPPGWGRRGHDVRARRTRRAEPRGRHSRGVRARRARRGERSRGRSPGPAGVPVRRRRSSAATAGASASILRGRTGVCTWQVRATVMSLCVKLADVRHCHVRLCIFAHVWHCHVFSVFLASVHGLVLLCTSARCLTLSHVCPGLRLFFGGKALHAQGHAEVNLDHCILLC